MFNNARHIDNSSENRKLSPSEAEALENRKLSPNEAEALQVGLETEYVEVAFPGRSPFHCARSALLVNDPAEHPDNARLLIAVQIDGKKYSLRQYVTEAMSALDAGNATGSIKIAGLSFSPSKFDQPATDVHGLEKYLIEEWVCRILELCNTNELKKHVKKYLYYINTPNADSLAMQSFSFASESVKPHKKEIVLLGESMPGKETNIEKQNCTLVVTNNKIYVEDRTNFLKVSSYLEGPEPGESEQSYLDSLTLLQFPDIGKKPMVAVTTSLHLEEEDCDDDLRRLLFSAALQDHNDYLKTIYKEPNGKLKELDEELKRLKKEDKDLRNLERSDEVAARINKNTSDQQKIGKDKDGIQEQLDIDLEKNINEIDHFSTVDLSAALIEYQSVPANNSLGCSPLISSVAIDERQSLADNIDCKKIGKRVKKFSSTTINDEENFSDFKNIEDFECFKKMPGWDSVLNDSATINNDSQVNQQRKHNVSYGSMRVKIARQYAHVAVATQAEIQASPFCELVLLTYIENIWSGHGDHPLKSTENHKRLLKTLFIYLQDCFCSDDAEIEIRRKSHINALRESPEKKSVFLAVIEFSIERFTEQMQRVNQQYANFENLFHDDLWDNVKILLQQVNLSEQLEALASVTKNKQLKSFSKEFLSYLVTVAQKKENPNLDFKVKKDFDRFIKDVQLKNFPDIIKAIIEKLKELNQSSSKFYRDYSHKPGERNNKLVTFRDYCFENIVCLVDDIRSYCDQVRNLCVYSCLLEFFSMSSSYKQIKTAVENLITKYSLPFPRYNRVMTVKKDASFNCIDQLIKEKNSIVAKVEKDGASFYWKDIFSSDRIGVRYDVLSTEVKDLLVAGKSLTDPVLIRTIVVMLEDYLLVAQLKKDSTQLEEMLFHLSYLSYQDKRKLHAYVQIKMSQQNFNVLRDIYIKICDSLAQDAIQNSGSAIDGDDRSVFFVDHAFYSTSVLNDAFDFFGQQTGVYLKSIESSPAEDMSDSYIYAVVLQHFYIGLMANYLNGHPQKEVLKRDFFHCDFICDDGEYGKKTVKKYFLKGKKLSDQKESGDERAGVTPEKLIKKIKYCVDGILSNEKEKSAYVKNLEACFDQSFSECFTSKAQKIIRVCVWMASLVNRHVLSKQQIESIYEKINIALQNLGLKKATSLWDAYKKIESLGESAKAVCVQNFSQEKLPDSPHDVLIRLVNKSYNLFSSKVPEEDSSTEDKILSSFDSQPLLLRKTLWRFVVENFIAEIEKESSLEQSKKSGRITNHMSVKESLKSSDPKQIINACLFEIYATIAELHLSETGPRPDLAAKELGRLQNINDGIRKKLLMSIRERLLVDPGFMANKIVPTIFFSNVKYEIFTSDTFVDDINFRFDSSQHASVENPLDLKGFIENLQIGLNYVLSQLSLADAGFAKLNVFFVPYFMESILTGFILIYEELFKIKGEIYSDVITLWQKCLDALKEIECAISTITKGSEESVEALQWCHTKGIGKSGVEESIYIFRKAWTNIVQRIFEKIRSQDLRKKSFSVELLCKNPDDIIISYNLGVLLGLNSSIIVSNRLWRDITVFDLTPEIARTLHFIFGPAVDEKPSSNTIDLRPCNSDFGDKAKILATFFTREESRKSYYPIIEVLSLGGVLCVLVDNKYKNYIPITATKLDGVANNILSIYEERLKIISRAQDYMKQAEFVEDIEILHALISSTPLNHPIVFIQEDSKKHGEKQCIEIYQDGDKIIKNKSCVGSSYLLGKAAMGLDEKNDCQLAGIIRCAKSVDTIDSSAKIKIDFLNLLIVLLQNAMALINRCDTIKIPLSVAFFSENVVYDDVNALNQCDDDELRGLFFLAVIYQVLIRYNDADEYSAKICVANMPDRFFHDKNKVVTLGKVGIVSSGILTCGAQGALAKDLEELDVTLKPGITLSECCKWYEQNQLSNKSRSRTSSLGSGSSTFLRRPSNASRQSTASTSVGLDITKFS